MKHTDFQGLDHVFDGAWKKILNAIQTAEIHGIGVLLGAPPYFYHVPFTSLTHFLPSDLHAAVGKQNGDSHSGVNGPVRFYEKKNLERTLDVLKLLVRNLEPYPNIVGVQLVNEPQNHASLPDWYTKALNKLRKEKGGDVPLFIHDAWNTGQYAELISKRDDFTVLDHHLYRCFTPSDHKLSGDELASTLTSAFLPTFLSHSQKARGNLVIAEYSSALNPASLRSPEAGEQDRQRRVFTQAELSVIEKCCGGSWFWNLKKAEECGWDAGWSLKDATRAEIAPAFHGVKRVNKVYTSDEKVLEEKKNAAFGECICSQHLSNYLTSIRITQEVLGSVPLRIRTRSFHYRIHDRMDRRIPLLQFSPLGILSKS